MAANPMLEQTNSSFDFGHSNEEQKKAIVTTEGPVLVLAGPGTGKTHTLVKRIVYLLLEKHARPDQLFVSTFTEKAAKELVTRLSNELPADFPFNPDEMYLDTFHSLCLSLIGEYADATNLPKSYKTADDATIDYLLTTHIDNFEKLRNENGRSTLDSFLTLCKKAPERESKYKKDRRIAKSIKVAVSAAAEEGASPQDLLKSGDPCVRAMGAVYQLYEELLAKNGLITFGRMQLECLRMLKDHPEVLRDLQDKLTYFLIDEYQDTNQVQEEILFLLAGKSRNIFVVGDDDQSLYRFRGATVRNILDFEERVRTRLGVSKCETFHLEENYRSEPAIIDFCNGWMSEIGGPSHSGYSWVEGGISYRAPKTLRPGEKDDPNSMPGPEGATEAACKVVGSGDAWRKSIIGLILTLKQTGAIHDYNQVAFLTRSTKKEHCRALQEAMTEVGIGVYSPRAEKFFDQPIVMQLFGMLLQLFKGSTDHMLGTSFCKEEGGPVKPEHAKYAAYVEECVNAAQRIIDANKGLKGFVASAQERHKYKYERANYSYTDILYEVFTFDPFKRVLGTDMNAGMMSQQDIRNVAKFVQLLASFEALVGVNKLCDMFKPGRVTYNLIGRYLHYLYDSGVREHEDEVEYAPSGCVSFLTIHQSKGLEFPVVIVDVSGEGFYKEAHMSTLNKAIKRALGKDAGINSNANCHDFWRLFYTAFSRAQNLLVVAKDEEVFPPSSDDHVATAFEPYIEGNSAQHLPDFNALEYINGGASLQFADVKPSQLKPVFSFTTHLGLYESCPRKYKFYRELGFPSKKATGMYFGTVVHQTIEDINKAILAGEDETYIRERMSGWLNANCAALELSEKTVFDKETRNHAYQQVERYLVYCKKAGRWDRLVEAEKSISLAREKYIAQGSVDLVKKSPRDDSLVIVDFKTGKKPEIDSDGYGVDAEAKRLLKRYSDQLNMYASLVSAQTDKDGNNPTISFTQLYFVGVKKDDPTFAFRCSEEGIERARKGFDQTADKIIAKDFSKEAEDPQTCETCDFRFYCGKAQPR